MTVRIIAAAPSELDRIDPPRLALWPDSGIEDLRAIVAAQPDYLVLVDEAKRRTQTRGITETEPVVYFRQAPKAQA